MRLAFIIAAVAGLAGLGVLALMHGELRYGAASLFLAAANFLLLTP